MTPPPYRVGQGYDIHRLVPDEPLWLGGIRIESPVGSLAHSDGDVILHSLIDALLGACGLGDIGDYFPPSDARHANRSSSEFLAEILPLLQRVGEFQTFYCVSNIDVTVFLEKPVLKPYKLSIRQKLAALLDLSLDCVSVKAKTAEKFPPVGSQEAIAASVTVLLQAQQ
jgi:2-C-methyl-D-erythritol 2,4-cyclodiphosphate synthase